MIHRSTTAFACACLAGLSAATFAAEYVGPGTPDASLGVPTATDNLRGIPRNAYETNPAVGVPVSSLFRDTRAPYYDTVRNMRVTPSLTPAESLRLTTDVDLPDFRGRFPLLQRGFAPEDADLKVGPLYFNLRHISAGILYSDNINHTETNREQDWIGVISVGAQVMAQLTEGFHIAASGNFVYYPFEGRAGVAGFALRAPYSFGITSTPAAQAQIAWEPVIFGLPFVIADEFRVGLARFSTGAYDGFTIFEGFEPEAGDRSGVYSFRGPRNVTGDEFRQTSRDDDAEILYYANEISIGTSGPLPGQHIFRFRASHENIWYQDDSRAGFDGDRGRGSNLPSSRDQVSFNIESVRENLRFKPYLRYDLRHRDNPERLDHRVRFGIRGPITDLLFLRSEIGYLWQTERGTENWIWRTGLYHTPSPYTNQSLEFLREQSEFQDELDQQLIYRITKTLGPDLSGTAYTSYHWIDDLEDSASRFSSSREEWRSGIRLSYIYSPKTTFRLTGQYSKLDYDDEFAGTSESWRGRFEVAHRFHERISARLIYQHERRESDRIQARNYYENLAYLSLSWFFE